MKCWYALSCPCCGFRYPLKKFASVKQPILYPVQVVAGGGRASGFNVLKYLPWSMLPTLRKTEVWSSLLCLYDRLADAYDRYFEILGFLSPRMQLLLQELRRSYGDTYGIETLSYGAVYSQSPLDVTAPYRVHSDYSKAYESPSNPLVTWGACA